MLHKFIAKSTSVLILLLAICQSTLAATISVSSDESVDRPAIIIVSGDFAFGDDKTFAKLALQFDKALVFFSSNGGNLAAGLGIGKAIRIKQFDTAVTDADTCASACALAWLGGNTRLLSASSKVGFHAAYLDNNGSLQESGLANALVGAYLNQLGLSDNAVAYITHAAPQSMQWLNITDAQTHGIAVSGIPNSEVRAEEPPNTTETPSKVSNIRIAAGIDLFGQDLPSMPIVNSTWASCNQDCTNHKECVALTFNSRSKTCFLKQGVNLAVNYEPATSAYLNSIENQITFTGIKIHQRTDVIGSDFGTLTNISMEGCIKRCHANSDCKAFSYVLERKSCWLKQNASQTKKIKGIVSGIK